MAAPLIVTEAQVNAHFKRMNEILASAVDLSAKTQVTVDSASPPLVGGLTGAGCEFITRNRGLRVPVAPFLQLQHGVWAWLGYREEWDYERPVRNIRRFSFRTVGLTIHFGLRNSLFKPQMFRGEWAGWAKWGGKDYGFQAADAGHPHWQFDALDSLPDESFPERAAELRELLSVENDGNLDVKEFSPQLTVPEIRAVVTAQKLSRIHFASAAAWWKPKPHDDHAHGPISEADIENWVRHTLHYLRRELQRLQAG
ncbi:MAG: hypothetical protein IRZ04_05140 [Rhodospirillales bacterium]|nr:hypothetical protein [Rhodospirillales bacterium]